MCVCVGRRGGVTLVGSEDSEEGERSAAKECVSVCVRVLLPIAQSEIPLVLH